MAGHPPPLPNNVSEVIYMFMRGYVLDTTEKLAAAQHNQQHVEVYKAGVHQHSGLIESCDENAVYINGGYFQRDFHVFKIR